MKQRSSCEDSILTMKQKLIENILNGIVDEVDLLEFVTDNDYRVIMAVVIKGNVEKTFCKIFMLLTDNWSLIIGKKTGNFG